MRNGIIITGYQGIGKSSISGSYDCVDLESGNFWVDGRRMEDWCVVYANIAEHIAGQGYTVLTSSHRAFRDELRSRNVEFVTVSPSKNLKEQWIARLRERYEVTKSDKDFKAWRNAEEMFDENIEDLQSEENRYVIRSMDYRLCDIVESIRNMR